MRKYRNIKVGKYDSKKEKNRADLLKILEKQGQISNLKEQVKFVLVPAQYEWYERQLKTKVKIVERCVEKECSYIADFTYCDVHGNFIVEDVKGVRTEVYKIKKKLMLQVHGIRIKEV